MSDAAALAMVTHFLARLSAAKMSFTLGQYRDDSIAVCVSVPGERWEVEFFANGTVEVERFVSTGTIEDAVALDDLFRKHSD